MSKTISNIKVGGTTYAINDSTKAGLEEVNELIEITTENNASILSANNKLDELLSKVESSGIDVSFVTATADDILAGKVGVDVNGNPVNGMIQTVMASLSGNVVTVPAGYHTANTLTVAEASTPTVSGNEVTIYKGYYPEQKKVTVETHQGGMENEISVVKITKYIPYSAAYSGVMSVTVSGLTDLEQEEETYSSFNGTYNVTPETAGETDWKKRVYKHESNNRTISYDVDPDEPDYAYWRLNDENGYGIFMYYTDEDIPNGTNQWENYDWGGWYDVTTAPITESVPEVQMELKGQKAESYDNDTMQWTFSTSVSDFSGFEFEPQTGQLFLLNNQKLICNTLGFDPGDMQNNALMYSNYGQDEGTPLEGKAAVYAFKTTIDGISCMAFDAQSANDNINYGAESYLFIKIPTAIKPKTTPLSLAVEMYCTEWGNSGATIAGLCKGYTPGSADRDKDTLQRPLLGIAFCPNHGFEVMTNDSHPGAYPADYKKVYDAYDGKWTLFTINIDGNLMSVYFGDERKIVTSISWSDSDEFNYVYLRPGIIGNNYGRIFVFDRLLGENEIAYQVKKLREISGK